MDFVFDPPPPNSVAITGGGRFPVRRIFCIGKNYAKHVREMGGDPVSDPPVFFTKPADALVATGAEIPYAQATENLHYEGELVVALARGGCELSSGQAKSCIFGFTLGCDLTRRDHQARAKKAGTPWDTAKGFDNSAPVGPITPASEVSLAQIEASRLKLSLNGKLRQSAPLTEMIWSIPDIIAALSGNFELKPGDLIFTGSPYGVGPLSPGDVVKVELDGLAPLSFSIAA